MPPSSQLASRIQTVKYETLNGDTVQEGVCPPCEVTIRFKTSSEDDLHEWLRQFCEHTRTDYIVNFK